jgi:hypothetical protein
MTTEFDTAIAAMTPDIIGIMTSQEAGAKLAELSAAHERSQRPPAVESRAVTASRNLKALQKDEAWGKRLMAGDWAATRDFNALSEAISQGSAAEFAMAGEIPANHIDGGTGMPLEDQVKVVSDLRARGQGDKAIMELLSGVEPTAEQHQIGKRNNARRFADADWVARLAAHDPQAQSEFIVNSWAIGCRTEAA